MNLGYYFRFTVTKPKGEPIFFLIHEDNFDSEDTSQWIDQRIYKSEAKNNIVEELCECLRRVAINRLRWDLSLYRKARIPCDVVEMCSGTVGDTTVEVSLENMGC